MISANNNPIVKIPIPFAPEIPADLLNERYIKYTIQAPKMMNRKNVKPRIA